LYHKTFNSCLLSPESLADLSPWPEPSRTLSECPISPSYNYSPGSRPFAVFFEAPPRSEFPSKLILETSP